MNQSPNLLIILSDQLRRQSLDCYGDPNILAPHIAALARRGVRCDAASATCPVCVPFRYTLMTGQYPHSCMVPSIDWRMSPSENTLADAFNSAGYQTLYFGKWHLYGGFGPGLMKKHIPRSHQGRWEEWFGFEFRNDFFDNVCFHNEDPTPIPLPGYQPDAIFNLAIDRLARHRDPRRPFCAVISVEPPHPPFGAPESYERIWRSRDLALPPNFMTSRHHASGPGEGNEAPNSEVEARIICQFRSYYAMIQNLDDNVGRLMDVLRTEQLADETIVAFLSDHGELMGSHGLMSKQFPYEESCGIPLIVAGPGISPGSIVTEPLATEDLYPTFLGLAGLGSQEGLFGADASPLLRGEPPVRDRDGVMLEFIHEHRSTMPFYGQAWRGFRSRRYKYTVLGAKSDGLEPWQLFDLQEDPWEERNLIEDSDHKEIASEHHHWLRERMVETEDHEWLKSAFGCEGLNSWVVVPSTKGFSQ